MQQLDILTNGMVELEQDSDGMMGGQLRLQVIFYFRNILKYIKLIGTFRVR